MKSKVYFSKNLDKSTLVELFKKIDVDLVGNVAIKVH